MSYTKTMRQVDEWEEEFCDNCDHPKGNHYNPPQDVHFFDGRYMYTASGCMILKPDGRKIENNPYTRCECTEFK